MSDHQYLIALALLEQSGSRSMPLNGKMLKAFSSNIIEPDHESHNILLELLLRIWQRSEDGYLRKFSSENSLLLVSMNFEEMNEKLPLLKSRWLSNGNDNAFVKNLLALNCLIWRVVWSKQDRIQYIRIMEY